MAGERRQLARVRRLVQREQDQRQTRARCRSGRAGASARERSRCASGCRRPCRGRSARTTCGLWLRNEPGWICITRPSSRLILAISVSICPRNASASAGVTVALERLGRTALRSRCASKIRGLRGRVAVIGRRRAHRLEECAPLAVRGEVAAPRPVSSPASSPSFATFAAKPSNSGSTTGSGRYAVTTRPFQPLARIFAWCASGSSGDSVVAITSMLKRSNSARGRNSGLASAGVDLIEQPVGGLRRQPLANAEHLVEGVIEPDAGRRAAEQLIVRGEGPPDLARVGFDRSRPRWRPDAGDRQVLERDALAVEHAEDVMVRA